MIGRYLDGKAPAPPSSEELTASEQGLIDAQEQAFTGMTAAMDAIAPHEACKAVWGFVRKANAYVEEVTPWALAKDDAQRRRLEVVLYHLADGLRIMAPMLAPILPRSSQELWERLDQPGSIHDARFDEHVTWGALAEGARIALGDPLFPRLEDTGAS